MTPTDATTDTPQVVFACVKNGGRSVISRVLTEHYAVGRVRALSAGTQPGEHIHPEVADALERLGLDTSKRAPQAAHPRDHRRQRPRHHPRLW
jgi:arsenate reductase